MNRSHVALVHHSGAAQLAFVLSGFFGEDVAFERARLMPPLPSTLKRFFALDLVFILGMGKLHWFIGLGIGRLPATGRA